MQLKPATLTSTLLENPFAGKANVRLTKVRVWVTGAKTRNNNLQIKITHNGHEKIISKEGETYVFAHESINRIFEYSLVNKELPIIDGDIGLRNGNRTYALVGPFTWWTITIDPNDNPGLDMTQVSGVDMAFQGQCYAFEGNA